MIFAVVVPDPAVLRNACAPLLVAEIITEGRRRCCVRVVGVCVDGDVAVAVAVAILVAVRAEVGVVSVSSKTRQRNDHDDQTDADDQDRGESPQDPPDRV